MLQKYVCFQLYALIASLFLLTGCPEKSSTQAPQKEAVKETITGLQFNGVDSYVEIPTPGALRLGGSMPFTYEAWVKLAHEQHNQSILSRSGNSDKGFWFIKRRSGLDNALSFLGNFVSESKRFSFSSNTYLPESQWTHIAVTHDGNGLYSLYVNGAEVSASETKLVNTEDIGNILVGARAADVAQIEKVDSVANGVIRDLRIWNVARDADEIQKGTGVALLGNEPGLVGYWPMNEGAGDTVGDKTSNANHGILHGARWWSEEK